MAAGAPDVVRYICCEYSDFHRCKCEYDVKRPDLRVSMLEVIQHAVVQPPSFTDTAVSLQL